MRTLNFFVTFPARGTLRKVTKSCENTPSILNINDVETRAKTKVSLLRYVLFGLEGRCNLVWILADRLIGNSLNWTEPLT